MALEHYLSLSVSTEYLLQINETDWVKGLQQAVPNLSKVVPNHTLDRGHREVKQELNETEHEN